MGNVLLLGAISVSSLSVAVPAGAGTALLVRSVLEYFGSRSLNGTFVFTAAALLLATVVAAALGYRGLAALRHEEMAKAGKARSTRRPAPLKAIVLSVCSGLFLGSFPLVMAKTGNSNFGLGPYSTMVILAAAVLFSSFVYGIFLMNLPIEGEPVDFVDFLRGGVRQHGFGLLGGMLAAIGLLTARIVVMAPPEAQIRPPLSAVLTQAWPLVAVLLGLALWNEAKGADTRIRIFLGFSVVLLAGGIALLALAPISGAAALLH
jgi:hypothetical protein